MSNTDHLRAEPPTASLTLVHPALFVAADEASAAKQRAHLNLIRLEYALLIIAAAMLLIDLQERWFLMLYAAVFILSLCVLILRSYSKPEQGWYMSRALAESVKTLSWRFAMRADPYNGTSSTDAKRTFRDNLTALLGSSRQIGESLAGVTVSGNQITPSMVAIRDADLPMRKAIYLRDRVLDQHRWYTAKAKANARSGRMWFVLGILAYGIAAGLVLTRIDYPSARLPIEPLIVMASAILGWMQIKKFNELSSAYALAAHEIGLAEHLVVDAGTEEQFIKAVVDVELAFSREHTQWTARQNN